MPLVERVNWMRTVSVTVALPVTCQRCSANTTTLAIVELSPAG
jgi:hypothetical protein